MKRNSDVTKSISLNVVFQIYLGLPLVAVLHSAVCIYTIIYLPALLLLGNWVTVWLEYEVHRLGC